MQRIQIIVTVGIAHRIDHARLVEVFFGILAQQFMQVETATVYVTVQQRLTLSFCEQDCSRVSWLSA